LLLHNPLYKFKGHTVIRSNGKQEYRSFAFTNWSKEYLLTMYDQLWREKYGDEPPQTEFL